MSNPVFRGFANVARFAGRDTRSQFWPFAAAAVGLYLVVGWAVVTPIMFPVFAESEPSAAAFQTMTGRFMLVNLLMFLLLILLLAAAVVRRLRDGGRSPLWGLTPLPFAAYSSAMFVRLTSQFNSGGFDTRIFFSAFVSNILYMAGVVALIVLLAMRSAPERASFD